MRVKYGENIYCFEGDLDCLYFSNLIEEGIEEVELNLFEDVFKSILYDTFTFEEEKDYITLYKGLSYFGSEKEKELINFLKNKIYEQEKKILQREIVKFFQLNINDIDWDYLCRNPSIPFEFFKEHKDIISWASLCANPSIPLEFFKENINKANNNHGWENLCLNLSIPFEFLEKYIQRDLHYLFANPSTPLEFIKKHINDSDRSWCYICQNPSIPLDFIKEHIDKIGYYAWNYLCRNPSIPLEFFKEHKDKIHWWSLCYNPSIPHEFFKEHINSVDWRGLCLNPSIPLEFFKEHINRLDWTNLCYNPSIPFEFLKENILYIDEMNMIYFNPNIPIQQRKMNNKLKMSFLCKNTFNLEKRVRDKIKSTIYFDFKPLNDIITK